jgi:hypothetical protein
MTNGKNEYEAITEAYTRGGYPVGDNPPKMFESGKRHPSFIGGIRTSDLERLAAKPLAARGGPRVTEKE